MSNLPDFFERMLAEASDPAEIEKQLRAAGVTDPVAIAEAQRDALRGANGMRAYAAAGGFIVRRPGDNSPPTKDEIERAIQAARTAHKDTSTQ
jgi:hypothetical protein